jgi:hypothetical protein
VLPMILEAWKLRDTRQRRTLADQLQRGLLALIVLRRSLGAQSAQQRGGLRHGSRVTTAAVERTVRSRCFSSTKSATRLLYQLIRALSLFQSVACVASVLNPPNESPDTRTTERAFPLSETKYEV